MISSTKPNNMDVTGDCFDDHIEEITSTTVDVWEEITIIIKDAFEDMMDFFGHVFGLISENKKVVRQESEERKSQTQTNPKTPVCVCSTARSPPENNHYGTI